MSKALVLGAVALAFSAGAASAQVPGYNYNGATVPLYGYAAPGYGYAPPGYGYAPSGYGYAAPAPLYDYAPQPYGYAAPGYGSDYSPPGSWARGYWGRRGYGGQ
jgi:hypothetical protein